MELQLSFTKLSFPGMNRPRNFHSLEWIGLVHGTYRTFTLKKLMQNHWKVSKSGYLYPAPESWRRLKGAGQSRTGMSSVPAWRRSPTGPMIWVQCWWQTVPCGWSIDCETSLSSCSPGAWNQYSASRSRLQMLTTWDGSSGYAEISCIYR